MRIDGKTWIDGRRYVYGVFGRGAMMSGWYDSFADAHEACERLSALLACELSIEARIYHV